MHICVQLIRQTRGSALVLLGSRAIAGMQLITQGLNSWCRMQRVNGRIAMMAFLLISLGRNCHQGAASLQQLSVHPIWTTFFAITLSAASIMPKVVSGMPLEALQNAASRDDLPEKLRFFNKTHEIWVGRVAMLGLVGLTLTEAFITKGALFHRG